MRFFILSGLFLVLCTAMSYAKECSIGYEPPMVSFYVQASDINGMELSDSERGAAEEKLSTFQTKESELRSQFRDTNADMALMLSGPSPDRSKLDSLAEHLAGIIRELYALDVTYAVEMADLLKTGNLRKVKVKSGQYSTHCDEAISVPKMRYFLTGKDKSVVDLQEDEKKYLEEFERRETYFSTEKKRVRERLDRAVRAKVIDHSLLSALVDEWAMLIRQQITNRLDRYFYADQIIFSPERMEKLRAFNAKYAPSSEK